MRRKDQPHPKDNALLLERTADYALIRSIVTHPSVYRHIVDDFCPPAEKFRPVENDLIVYVTVRDGEELLGLFMLAPQNGITVEVHTCLLPCAYGARAAAAALAIVEWTWANTRCRRIVTSVPRHNRLALRFALAAGMEVYGINQESFLHHGTLEAQIMLGISQPKR